MLKHKKKVQRLIPDPRSKPKTILRKNMLISQALADEIIPVFIQKVKEINPKDPQIKFWYKEMTSAQAMAIDCAHKLAPYEHAKLESMEIKQTVEHRMVMRAPAKIANVEEWAKITGASVAKLEELEKKQQEFKAPAASIHDFDNSNEDLDELETQKRLN